MSAPASPSEHAVRQRREALGWFVRRRDAAWRPVDEADFQRWLAQHPDHPAAYARCATQWQSFDAMPHDLVAGLRRTVARDRAALAPPMPDRRRFLQPVLALGSAAAMGGVGVVAWRQLDAQPLQVESLSTARGQQKDVELPDGTRLRLDTATRVEVAYFRDRREVRLIDGQAVFSVQPDAARPFDVRAGPLRVTVVGTRFSVRHTPGQPGHDGVSVAVEEGKVRVARAGPDGGEPAPGSALFLTAGEQVAGDAAGALGPVGAVPADGIAPWRAQRVSFVDARLDHALAELARYGPTGLVVRDPQVAALRLTGTFDPLNPATLRLALARALPVRLVDTATGTAVVVP